MNAVRSGVIVILLGCTMNYAFAQSGGSNLPEPPAQPPSAGWEDDRSIPGVQPGSGACCQAHQRLERYLAEMPIYRLATVWTHVDAGQIAPMQLAGVTYSDFRDGVDLGLAGILQRRSGASFMFRYANLPSARRDMVRAIEQFNERVRRRSPGSGGPNTIDADLLRGYAKEAGTAYAAWVDKPHYAIVASASHLDGWGDSTQAGVAASWLRPLGRSGADLGSVSSGLDLAVTGLYVSARPADSGRVSCISPSFTLTWWDKVARWCEDTVNDQRVGFVSRWNTQVGVRVGARDRINAFTPWRAFVRVRFQPDQRKGMTPSEFLRNVCDVTLSVGSDSMKRRVFGVGFSVAR